MSTIASVLASSIYGPATPVPQGSLEVVATATGGYTVVSPADLFVANPPATPLSKLAGVFAGSKVVPTSAMGSGFGRFPVIRTEVGNGLNLGVVRIHDFSGGDASWRWAWGKVETTQGVYNWGYLDVAVDAAVASGKKVTMTLWGTPTWASARPAEIGAYGAGYPGFSAEPADLATWDSWCTAVANRYKGKITHYEIWNEPNSTAFFSGTQTQLAQMTRRAAVAIKAIDPAALIISPPVTSLATGGNGLAYFLAMMQASDGVAGAMKDWVDVIGCHLYPGSFSTIKDIPGMISGLRAHMTTLGVAAKPLWNTEYGVLTPAFATLTSAQRKAAIQALMTVAFANNAGGVDVSIWYNPDSPGSLVFTQEDVNTWNTHLALMGSGSGITVVNTLKDGRVAAVINGTQFLWG